ncbi:TPA: hypothetical protein RY491_004428 [Escherichia albertii]|nr:hypothetical protein [Escherichia albertii]MCW3803104.1 hypothetical protein [Escherichia albertii]HCS7033457.1 hypothetical protein [Escherichia albertii]HCS7475707.1 hypothetical protein [Escherichia albertii]HEB1023567.1 hypothetical protein [Escherichia albertii]HEB1094422.1 hypothetical protein [Escherichia albertii]
MANHANKKSPFVVKFSVRFLTANKKASVGWLVETKNDKGGLITVFGN